MITETQNTTVIETHEVINPLGKLDLVTHCSNGYEFEYVGESDGIPTGLFITVLGKHAPSVQKWQFKKLNQFKQIEQNMIRRGQDYVRPVEEENKFAIENAAIRIVSWRGNIGMQYTPENAILLCTQNPEIREEVIRESEKMGNFIQSK